ncbi:MAG: hypothetical protein ACREXG_16205, partial [Polaromonas sp.]
MAIKALALSQRASRVLAFLLILSITFIMNPMVLRHSLHIKMPRLDAYSSIASMTFFLSCASKSPCKGASRVAGGFYPPAPTPPTVRVGSGRLNKLACSMKFSLA